jgi:hypothetical protein
VLNVDTLRANAVAKAGTDQFGDEWFLEPLGVLVKALNEEAQLNETGHQMTERRLTALLVDRLRLRALQKEHPEIADTEVVVAAEILGLPRTGSTLMHRLLSASPQLTSTLSWECSYPLPFPGESPAAEVRKGKAKKMMEMSEKLSPEFGDIHTTVWDGPEEDILLLDRTFTSMSYDSFYWAPSYGDWLRTTDQSRAYDELREWLQALQWQDPERTGKKWVLKSPHHLTAVETTLDAFPECKIVMTHRTPISAVPSYASMVSSLTAIYSDSGDAVKIGQYWSARFVESLRQFDEVRKRRPDRFIDVPFKQTVSEPLETVTSVMEQLGLPVSDDDIDAFNDYLEINRQERHGSHSYTAEDFGLSTEQLASDFASYESAYLS